MRLKNIKKILNSTPRIFVIRLKYADEKLSKIEDHLPYNRCLNGSKCDDYFFLVCILRNLGSYILNCNSLSSAIANQGLKEFFNYLKVK